MSNGRGYALAAAGLIGMAAFFGASDGGRVALAAAGDQANALTDISAQKREDRGRSRPAPGGGRSAVPRGGAPRFVAPPRAPRVVAPRGGPRTVAPRVVAPRVGPRVVAPGAVAPRIARPPGARPGVAGPAVVGPRIGRRAPSATFIQGRQVRYIRGPWTVRRGSIVRRLVAASILAPIVIGAAYYYPYAYLPIGAPYCVGLTYDGCELRWHEVPTVDGFTELQCVAFCPWQ